MDIQKTESGVQTSDIDKEYREKLDNFNKKVNSAPAPQFIKKNKFAGNSDYLPVGYLEIELDRIYQLWEWEISQVQLMANSVVVHGNLRVLHPVTKTFITRSGVGSVPIELRSGANPNDVNAINSKAIQKNAPAASSYAFKNACKSLGKMFGRDLNREDIAFEPYYTRKAINDV